MQSDGVDVPEVPAEAGWAAYPDEPAPAATPQWETDPPDPVPAAAVLPVATVAELPGCAGLPAEAEIGCAPADTGGAGAVSAIAGATPTAVSATSVAVKNAPRSQVLNISAPQSLSGWHPINTGNADLSSPPGLTGLFLHGAVAPRWPPDLAALSAGLGVVSLPSMS